MVFFLLSNVLKDLMLAAKCFGIRFLTINLLWLWCVLWESIDVGCSLTRKQWDQFGLFFFSIFLLNCKFCFTIKPQNSQWKNILWRQYTIYINSGKVSYWWMVKHQILLRCKSYFYYNVLNCLIKQIFSFFGPLEFLSFNTVN